MSEPVFLLPEAVALLRRTPGVLDALLSGLPDTWTRCTEGENTWSPYDIVGHLIHGEHTNWIPRARHILEHGDSQPFPPFDRSAQFTESRGKSLQQLLKDFAQARAESLAALERLNLTPDDLDRRGLHFSTRAGNVGETALHLGHTRPDASASDLARNGQAVCRRCGAVVGVSGRAALRRPQLLKRW